MGADPMSLAADPWYADTQWPDADDLRGLAQFLPQLRRPKVNVRIDRQADEPLWLPAVLGRLSVIGGLADNWDGDGAKAPSDVALTAALGVLLKLLGRESATPAVVPTPEGGIQFEWHDAGWDVEVEVDPYGTADAWGEHIGRRANFFGDVNDEDLCLAIKEITVHLASRQA